MEGKKEMKLKQIRMLCMITAIGAAAVMAGLETDGNERTTENQAVMAVALESGGILEDARFSEQASVTRLALPKVSAGWEESTVQEGLEEPKGTADLEQTETEGAAEALIEEESSLIIADVTNYVNIRSIPSEEGEILGKLYNNCVGIRYGEENGWYYITSGKVTGYVKADYVLIGEAAERKAAEVGTRLAEVTTTTLKVRKEPTTESIILGLVPGGDILAVLEEVEGWVKVLSEEGEGYVSADYVHVYTENAEAESREEEEARLKKEAEERRKADEAARKAIASQNNSSGSGSKNQGSGNSVGAGGSTSSSSGSSSSDLGSSAADLGQQIANYALQFVGNPYVYGGTSLTDGADCSGFVMSVFANFGISLPRTSGEQGASGSAVNGVENARPGDLVWYSGHIGIYIGNSQIVHASNSQKGIIVSSVNFGKILGIRRIV